MRSINPRSTRSLADIDIGEISIETNRTNADRDGSNQLLGPPHAIEAVLAIDFGKLRVPKAPLRAMQNVH